MLHNYQLAHHYFYYQPNYNTIEVYISCSTDFGFSWRDLSLEVNVSIFNLNMSVCKQSKALKN